MPLKEAAVPKKWNFFPVPGTPRVLAIQGKQFRAGCLPTAPELERQKEDQQKRQYIIMIRGSKYVFIIGAKKMSAISTGERFAKEQT